MDACPPWPEVGWGGGRRQRVPLNPSSPPLPACSTRWVWGGPSLEGCDCPCWKCLVGSPLSPEPHSELKELKGAPHPAHALLDFSVHHRRGQGALGCKLLPTSVNPMDQPVSRSSWENHCLRARLGREKWRPAEGLSFPLSAIKILARKQGLSFRCLLSAADSQTELLDTVLASSYFSFLGCKQFCFSLCFAFLLGL